MDNSFLQRLRFTLSRTIFAVLTIASILFVNTPNAYAAAEPSFTSAPITTATAGEFYSYAVTTTPGDGGGTLSIVASSTTPLPTGLGLLDNGDGSALLSGTSTVSGTFPMTLVVSNASSSLSAEQTFSLDIAPAPTISIQTTTLPDGTVDGWYAQTVQATSTKATDTLTWSIFSGNLPTGLSLDSATGMITGTTTAAGDYSFTVSVLGANTLSSPATQALSIHVGLAQTIDFAAITAKTYGDADFLVSASSTSALLVSFSSTSTACSITNHGDGTATVHIATAGTCAIAADQAGDATYSAAPTVMQSLAIAQIALTPSVTANDKEYDGTTSAVFATSTLTGIINLDDVILSGGTGTFDTKHIGTGKTVTVSGLTLSGAQAGNYALSTTSATTSAAVTVRAITVTAATSTKAYDAATSSPILPTITSGSLGTGDTASFIETFDTQHVGSSKTLTPSGVVNDGNGGANYTVTFASSTTGTITAATLTVTAQADTKPYDTTTSASTSPLVSGLKGTDSISGLFETYDTPGVNTGKTLTVSTSTAVISDGNSGNNYSIVLVSSANGIITAKPLTVTGLSASDKVYDNGLTAAISGTPALVGIIPGDDVSATGTPIGAFATKNASSSISVAVSGLSLSGAQASNYSLTAPTLTAAITAKALTIGAALVSDKAYDGTLVASTTPGTLGGFIGTETVTATSTGSFDTKQAGTGKTVTILYTLFDGTNGGLAINYSLASTTATANITARTLTVTATSTDQMYDATTTAAVTLADDRIAGDSLTDSYVSALFSDKNIGTNKLIAISGISIGGTDAIDYILASTTATTSASVTTRLITVSAQSDVKTYDASTTAATLPTITSGSLAPGDTASFIETYDTKTVGSKTLTPSGFVNDGNGGANYTVTFATTTGTISQAGLSISGLTAVNKAYDGTDTASTTGNAILSGTIFGTDSVTLTGTATSTFADKVVGNAKTVTVGGLSLTSADASNYLLTIPTLSADITTKSISASGITASNKTYDGTQAATLATTSASLLHVAPGDTVTLDTTNAIGTFSDKIVATGKTVTVSGLALTGTDAGNYSLSTTTAIANIIARTLTVSATSSDKIYDANNTATVFLLTDKVAGDAVTTANSSATFSDANIGTGKLIMVSGISITGGTDAVNYSLGTTTATTTGNITVRQITVTAQADTKEYDATTTAATLPTITSGSLAPGDTASFIETYDTKTVGSKTLTPSGFVNDGNGGANYTVTFATTTGTISAKDLTITGVTANDKTYDNATSTTLNTGSAALHGVMTGDSVTIGGTPVGAFADASATSTKLVTISGFTLLSADAPNYTLSQPTTTASITPAPLAVRADAQTKTYGDADPSLTYTLTSGTLFGSDAFSGSLTRAVGENVGTHAITQGGLTAGSNYTITFTNDNLTVSARPITVTAAADTKVYDTTLTASTTPTITSGSLAPGDTANFVAAYSTKDVGTTKTLTPSGSVSDGNSGNNYAVTFVAANNGTITAAPLTITAQADTKTYDASTTAATLPTVAGLKGSDSVSNLKETYTDGTAGSGKTLQVSSYVVNDGNSGNNYGVTLVATSTGSISQADLTVTADPQAKTYGDANPTLTATIHGFVGGETLGTSDVTDSATLSTLAMATSSVGTYQITVGTSTLSSNNYRFASSTNGTLTVSARPITVSAQANTKAYDASTTAATLPTITSGSLAPGDTASFIETYDTKTVGSKTLTPSGFVNDGNGGANYTVTFATTTGTITTASTPLTITGLSATDKAYDGGLVAAITGSSTLNGVFSGDTVNITGSPAGTFADKVVGTSKNVDITGLSLIGADASNYALASTTATANIFARILTVFATSSDKVYDATQTASTTLSTDKVAGDVVTLARASSAFDTAFVGTGKLITVSGISVTGGADAANYSLGTTTATTTGNITVHQITVTAQADTKEYDATTTAATLPTITSGSLAPGDTASFMETYDTKGVGTGKTLTPSGIVNDGNGGANYQVTFVTATGTITTKNLTITGVIANNKTYDNATTTTLNIASSTLAGIMPGDTVTLGGTPVGSFVDVHASTTKPVVISGFTLGGLDAPNYTVTQPSTTADITPAPLAVHADAQTKTYGDADPSLTYTLTSGTLFGSDAFSGSLTRAVGENVGTYAITQGGLTAGSDYHITYTTHNLAVTARPITVSAQSDVKTYDASTTAATLPTITSGSLAPGDTASFIETYDTKDAGAKTLTPSGFVNDGNGGANYTVTFATTTGTINTRSITVTAAPDTKIYDTHTTASTTPTITAGSLALGDTANFIEVYDTKDVASGKVLTPSGTVIDGNGGNNYHVTFTSSANGTITVAPLTISAQADTKIYDANTTASTTPIVAGLLGSDTVTGLAETYDTPHAGTGKTLSVSAFTVNDGNSGGNYSVTLVATSTGAISTKALTITANSLSKTYDASAFSGGNGVVYAGFAGSDSATDLGGTLVYGGSSQGAKDVGSYIIAPSGLTSADYGISFATSTLLIGKADLTVTADPQAKTYGDANPTLTATIHGFVGGETLGTSDVTGSATLSTLAMATSSVGTYQITVGTSTLSSNNYRFASSTNGTLTVSARPITISAQPDTKVYDTTTSASTTPIITAGSLAAGDTLGFIETYDTKNIGVGKTLTPSGIVHDGNGGANYAVTFATSTGTITVATPSLVITGLSAHDKTYDGNQTASITGTPTLVGIKPGDDVTLTGSAIGTFSDKNVATGKTVTITGLTLTGADAGNYALATTTSTADIGAKTISVSATGVDKVYDASTTASVVLHDTRIAGDVLTDSYTNASFIDPNVSTGKFIDVAGISISGTDAINYILFNTTTSAHADITVRPLTVFATGINKAYDATTTASTTLTTDALPADSGSITAHGTGNFADAQTGTGKLVTVTGILITGATSNYRLVNTTATTTANITPFGITITAQSNTKPYDGTTAASTTPIVTGLKGTDTVTGLAETYDTPHAGTGKTLSVSAFTVNDSNGGANYTVTLVNATGTITALSQTITFGALSDKHFGDADFLVIASSTSGLPVSFIATGACTASSTTIHLTGTGSCTVTAQQAGDTDYSAAPDVSQTFSVVDGIAPVITINGASTEHVAINNTYTDPGATATDNIDGNISVTTGGSVNTGSAGTYTLTYDAVDSSNNHAVQKTRSVVVDSVSFPLNATSTATSTIATLATPLTLSTTASGISFVATIPASTTITATSTWNGVFTLPTPSVSYTSPVAPAGYTLNVFSAVELGAGDTPLTLDRGVRIVFAGEAGHLVGWSQAGVFTQITATCAADSQAAGDALAARGDCTTTTGNDLVVWTKHLSTFMTYAFTPIPAPAPTASATLRHLDNGSPVGLFTYQGGIPNPLNVIPILLGDNGTASSTQVIDLSAIERNTQLIALYTKLIQVLTTLLSTLSNRQ